MTAPWASARSSYYASLYSAQQQGALGDTSTLDTLDTPTLTATIVETTEVVTRYTTNSEGLSTSFTSASLQISTLSALPLTTIFTPPATCSSRPFTLSISDNITIGIRGFSSNLSDPCYPTDWATAKTNYYSPGVCPEDHTCAGVFSGQSLGTPYTSVNCCPRSMNFWDPTQCRTLITTPTYALLPNSETSVISNFPFTGFATPVRVVWSPEDLSLFTPGAAPAKAVAAQQKKDAAGLPVGGKVGIDIGVGLGVLLLVGVGIFAGSRVRKQRFKRLQVASNSSSDGGLKPELPGDSKAMAELDDQAESREMEGDEMFPELAHLVKPSELEVPREVHELPG